MSAETSARGRYLRIGKAEQKVDEGESSNWTSVERRGGTDDLCLLLRGETLSPPFPLPPNPRRAQKRRMSTCYIPSPSSPFIPLSTLIHRRQVHASGNKLFSMDNTRALSLLGLPSEILLQIVSGLSRRDLSACVRVSKAWYAAFMDSLWHTVELMEASFFKPERPVFHRINRLYVQHLVIGGNQAVATKSPFLHNLHRIRVLKVQYTSFLNLFWDDNGTSTEAIPLEELRVNFEDNPKQPPPSRNVSGVDTSQATPPPPPMVLPKPAGMGAILQILGRSTRLSTFSFVAGGLVHKLNLEDQARLLANLSASVEKLDMIGTWLLRDADSVADDYQIPKVMNIMTELKVGGGFENLTTLSMRVMPADPILLVALLERSPVMEELRVDGYSATWSDAVLAEVISSVGSKGWKTLAFKSLSDECRPLTVAAILQNAGTLENLRLANCEAFDSKAIQKLLCSAPNLIRLDFIPISYHGELEPYSLMASDIVESASDWVCLGLETFKIFIGNVPRPDITAKRNGRRLTGIYNNGGHFSMDESRTIQRRVLAQLGRLTKLREITLGKDVVDYDETDNQAHWDEEDMEGDFYSKVHYELGSQYQCLSMSLQDGLDELKYLKCLRRLTLEKMSLGIGEVEKRWMKENWPVYGKESRETWDTFWTSRDHHVFVGTDLFSERFKSGERAVQDIYIHDWW